MLDSTAIKKSFEAMMFVWGSPLSAKLAAEVLDVPVTRIREAAEELMDEYTFRESGLMLREINGMYQICTNPDCEQYIAKLCTPVKEKRLSNAAMEVLAIVSYKQPVTRNEIEFIRGIKCDKVLDGLIRRGLVEEKGRGSGLGRPVLFGTTDLFLEKFGISSIKDLPTIEDMDILANTSDLTEDESTEFQQMSLDIE